MTMPFGKYRGYQLEHLPDGYLAWLCDLDDLRPRLKQAIEEEWERRHPSRQQAPPPGGSSSGFALDLQPEDRALLTDLLRAGYKALALKHHPDVGGQPDVMRRLNNLMEWLRQKALVT